MPSHDAPYKYFANYETSDRHIFFGRRRETQILLADIATTRLVVLFARTGTGKSSLINAGVRPRLHDRDYRTVVSRVGNDPVGSAKVALQREQISFTASDDLALLLGSAVSSLERPLVIFFDQFEEFFVNPLTREVRDTFIRSIGDIYRDANSGVHVVFSLREDYLAEMDDFREEIPAIFEKESQLRLRALTRDHAREAIVGPSRVVEPPFAFQDEVVERILDELPRDDDDLIQPVTLQIVCDTLWRRRQGAVIDVEQYTSLGQADGILKARIWGDLSDLDVDTLFALEQIVPLLRTEDATKRQRSFSELQSLTRVDAETIAALADTLCRLHLVRIETWQSESYLEWVSDRLALMSREFDARLQLFWLRRHRGSGPIELTRLLSLLENNELEKLLGDPEDWYQLLVSAAVSRDALGRWFERLADEETAWTLIARALDDPNIDPEDAQRLILYLGESRGGRPIEILGAELQKPDRARAALRALGAIRSDDAVMLIKSVIADQELQPAALDALRAIGGKDADEVADSIQPRGRSFKDFFVFGRRLSGMEPSQWDDVKSAIASGYLAAVLGPGVARGGTKLARALAEHFDYPFDDAENLSSVIEYLTIAFGAGWQKLLNEFDDMEADPPALYKSLAQLPFRVFVTSDHSADLEQVLEASGQRLARDPGEPDGTAIRVLHLFGSVRRPERLRSTTWRSEEAVEMLLLRARMHRSINRGAPRLMVTLGFDPADPAPYLVRRSLAGPESERVTMLIIATPPQLRSAQQLARAQDYYRQYARSERVMYYWGDAADFVKEMITATQSP